MNSWQRLGRAGASSLLMILMVSSVATAVTLQVASRVVQQSKISEGSGKVLSRDLVLRSALEYTKYALKNRWCMSAVWVQDPVCAANFAAALIHARGLERLLLTEDETNAIWLAMQHLQPGEVNPLANINSIRLSSIEQTVSIDSFNALNFGAPANGGLGENHPLYAIVKGLNKASIGALTFKLTRIVNNQNPDPTNWLRVRIRVASDSGSYVEETLLLSAVEIGTYALLMNGAINLTGQAVTGANFNVPTAPAKVGLGLSFHSPVFLNGNLVIPNSSVNNLYANVTFREKVVLAPLPPVDTVSQAERNAMLMSVDEAGDLEPYAPASFGGLGDSSYKDAKNFGGLLQGVHLQPSSDWGAFFLFDDRSNGVNPNLLRANMDVCVRRNQILGDLRITHPAVFVTKKMPPLNPPASAFRYLLGLSNGTNFYAATREQTRLLAPENPAAFPLTEGFVSGADNFNDLWAGVTDDNWDEYRRPVLRVEARFKGKDPGNPANTITLSSTTAYLSRESTFTIPTFAVDKVSFQALGAALNAAENTLTAKENNLDNKFQSLRNAIQAYNNDLNSNAMAPVVNLVPNAAPRAAGNVDVNATGNKLNAVQGDINFWQGNLGGALAPVLASFANLQGVHQNASTAFTQYQDALSARNSAKDALDSAKLANQGANRPKMVIQVQPNRLDVLSLSVDFINRNNLSAHLENIELEFFACEIGTTRHCSNLRTIATPPYSPTGLNVGASPRVMRYSVAGAAYSRTVAEAPPSPYTEDDWTTLNGTVIPENGGVIHQPPPAVDPQVIDDACNGTSSSRVADRYSGDLDVPVHLSESFPFAGFNYDFTSGSRVSWNFHPVNGTIEFDNSMEDDFHIYGIVDVCKIKSSMNFFSGFVVCKKFEIENRNSPLNIVGTVIAGEVSVHSNAIKKGVDWFSIYHPEGVRMLRKRRILRSGIIDSNGAEIRCDRLSKYVPGENVANASYPANPIWNPNPNLRNYAATFRCSPLSLRALSDPFTWNSLEPLCGIKTLPNGTYDNKTTCRARRPMAFKEIILGRSEK